MAPERHVGTKREIWNLCFIDYETRETHGVLLLTSKLK